jgi:hypothetical protein
VRVDGLKMDGDRPAILLTSRPPPPVRNVIPCVTRCDADAVWLDLGGVGFMDVCGRRCCSTLAKRWPRDTGESS